MGLRKKPLPTLEERYDRDIYHCCRWCHYYSGGKCYRDFAGVELNLFQLSESGKLSETLQETLSSTSTYILRGILSKLKSSGLSKSKVDDIYSNIVVPAFEEYMQDSKEQLDFNVDKLYTDFADDKENTGVYINDPESFFCKYFM